MEESGLEVGTPTLAALEAESGGLHDPGDPGQIEQHNETLCQSVGRGAKREEGKERGREEKEGEKESVSYPRQ